MKFEKGQRISIKGIKYDILTVLPEFDRFDENDENMGWHTRIELHVDGARGWPATHTLKIYDEDAKMILYEIKEELVEANLSNPKKTYYYKDVKVAEIKKEDVKIS